MKKIITIIVAILMFLPNVSYAKEESWERISGDDRYQTSVEISKKAYPNGSESIILTNGEVFADSISATPLAKKEDAPILLTQKSSLKFNIAEEIDRLKPKKVFIVGGENSVSKEIEDGLKRFYEVKRLSGNNRYETSVAVNEYVFKSKDLGIFVDGRNFADSVSIASYAYKEGLPLYLVEDSLPKCVEKSIKKIGIKSSIVIGGEGSVGNNAYNNLPDPYRIAGNNRYDTSRMIHEKIFENTNHVYLASGKVFADSLTGVVLAGKNESNILLLPKSCNEIRKTDIKFNRITAIGGLLEDFKSNPIVVYYVPHADDEVLAMGTAIRKDIVEGKEVHVILLTRGGASAAFEKLNKKLLEKNFPEITREEFMDGRTREMKEALKILGVNLNNFYVKDYPNNYLTKENVKYEIEQMIRKLGTSNIHHKAMGRFEYEKHIDHIACADAVKEYIMNNEFTNASFYAGATMDKHKCGFNDVKADSDIRDVTRTALNAYNIWDPYTGYYGIGFLSVKSYFDKMIEMPTSLIIEEY